MKVGLLGELQVEAKLVERDWHPIRLDTAQMASNADLMAVKGLRRVSIQIKTTDASTGHSHADSIFLGRASAKVFNSKSSPIIADVVIGVSYNVGESRFVVLPVALAEKICQRHARYWNAIPKVDGKKRSESFPIYLSFLRLGKAHSEYRRFMQAILHKYEDAWDILDEPIQKLHDPKSWLLFTAQQERLLSKAVKSEMALPD